MAPFAAGTSPDHRRSANIPDRCNGFCFDCHQKSSPITIDPTVDIKKEGRRD